MTSETDTHTPPRATTNPASTFSIPDPGPIGLVAFAATTLMLSVFNAGLLGAEMEVVVLPVALIYGGAIQIVVGIFEMFRKNLFGAAAFMTYGAFWIAFNGIVPLGLPGEAVGLFLLAFTIFTIPMTIITVKTNIGLLTTFTLLSITFVLLTLGAFTGVGAIHTAGGYFGIVTALAAWYVGFSGIANATWGRTVLPNKAL